MLKRQNPNTRLKSAKREPTRGFDSSHLIRYWKYLPALLGLLMLGGCSTVAYYGQSVIGHSRLMFSRQPIEAAIANAHETGDIELEGKLELAMRLRNYAISDLALPDNGSYSSYVALAREYPVWTVVAADEFSIAAKTWCYPVIGCAAYRGYFSRQAALGYADLLIRQGLETTVSGASAYSTLGWFKDPLLPSMMRNGEADFAETMFHELAHQRLYINGDSAFNEAFASVVGEQGAVQWLTRNRPDLLADYRLRLAARADFSALLDGVKLRLEALYTTAATAQEMRAGKSLIFGDLKSEYETLKALKWQGLAWFDRWFDEPVNNARLAAFSTYRDRIPAILGLFKQCRYDFKLFFHSLDSAEMRSGTTIVAERCVTGPD